MEMKGENEYGNSLRLHPKRRTPVEKILIVFCVFLSAAVISLIVAVAIVNQRRENEAVHAEKLIASTEAPQKRICKRSRCITAAARFINFMNRAEDPCDDFYEFACGNFIKTHEIPPDRTSVGAFAQLDSDVTLSLIDSLRSANRPNDNQAVKEARYFFQSCVDTDAIEKENLTRFKDIIREFGGWPVIDTSWNNSAFDLLKLLVGIRRYGMLPLINGVVSVDEKNTSRRIFKFLPSRLSMSRKFYQLYENNTYVQAYIRLTQEIMVSLGASEAKAQNASKDIIDFERKLAKLPLSPKGGTERTLQTSASATLIAETPQIQEEFDEDNSRITTAQKMMTEIPGFHWSDYIHGILNLSSNKIEFDDSASEILTFTHYLQNLIGLINKTEDDVLANYAIWTVVMDLAKYLPERFREALFRFNKLTSGQIIPPERSHTCSKLTNSLLSDGVANLYVKKHFQQKTKAQAEDMIYRIRFAFKEVINETEWMDKKTQKAARQKVDAVIQNIGYPAEILNDTFLNSEYRKFNFSVGFLDSVLKILQDRSVEELNRLNKPVDHHLWESIGPAVVNAFYQPVFNSINFPAAILQPPFYNKDYPEYLNYGGIGAVIGHELSHGFDNEGRLYDKDGNRKTWWNQSSINNFNSKAKKIIEQYGNFTVKQVNRSINGEQTQGENIADNGGLKIAYRAFLKLRKDKNKQDEVLPVYELTSDQLFFLQFGQIWCSKYTNENLILRLQSDPHSPHTARVIETLRNSEYFAEAYNCKSGSKMNPREKYSVW